MSALQLKNEPVVTPGGLARFLQLLSVLQRSKDGVPSCGIFAFTSAVRGEGVSYVANALARELCLLPRERVLLAQTSALLSLDPEDIDEERDNGLREVSPQLWVASPPPTLGHPSMPDLQPDLLDALRRRFTYVLVDCRAIRSSPEVLRISSQVDGILLVVGAGQSTRGEVQHAKKILQLASDKLLGCILNKQTNAIPNFLHRYMQSHHEHDEDVAIR